MSKEYDIHQYLFAYYLLMDKSDLPKKLNYHILAWTTQACNDLNF